MGSGSAVFSWNPRYQANNKNDFRDQNSHRFWDKGSTFWVKVWDQLRKNIRRYDPEERQDRRDDQKVTSYHIVTTI